MRRSVIARFFSKYGGDPVWLMSLSGWTFPDLPDVQPSLRGLMDLYEDENVHRFRVSDSITGDPFYMQREDARQLMEDIIEKAQQNPEEVLAGIGQDSTGTLTRKEAWRMARRIGKDREFRTKLAEVLQSE